MYNVDTLLGSILSCLDEPQRFIIIVYQAAIYMYCYLLSSYLMQVHNATYVKITLEHKTLIYSNNVGPYGELSFVL